MEAGAMWSMAAARVRASSAFAIAALCVSCATGTEPSQDTFAAALFGTRELPPNGSAASGAAEIGLGRDALTYSITATALSAPPLFVQLQIGTTEQAGAVVFRFEPSAGTGVITAGTRSIGADITYNTLTISRDSLRALMRAGLTYVNVYTAAYPGGEIRGQLFAR